MPTAKSRGRPRTKTSVIDKLRGKGSPIGYVYRDNGEGKPDGSYLLKYDPDKDAPEEILKKLTPGMYLFMEQGKDRPLKTARHIVDGEAAPETPQVTGSDDWFDRSLKYWQLRQMQRDLEPRNEYLELIKLMLEVTGPARANSDPVNLIEKGMDLASEAEPASPESMLAAAGLQALQKGQTDGGEMNTLKAALVGALRKQNEANAAIEKRLKRLEATPTQTVTEGAPMVSPESVFNILFANPCENADNLKFLLKSLNNSSGGMLKEYLRSDVTKEVRTQVLTAGLEQIERIDLLEVYEQAFAEFLGEASG